MGTAASDSAGLRLQAGALECCWKDGRLGPVFVDGVEVWHGVHFLLRDPHWRTPALRLEEPTLAAQGEGWRLQCRGRFDTLPLVEVHLQVTGSPDAHLRVACEAVAHEAVDVNRLGLCLLHPLSAAGTPVEVVHDDGRVSRSTWPELVPPWPPFMLVRALRHEYAPGAWSQAVFEGDVFEVEDQRNNTDASFKTYSRSNLMPRPYRLHAGEVVRQSVDLQVLSRPPAGAGPGGSAKPPLQILGPAAGPTPSLGLEIEPADFQDAEALRRTMTALALLRPAHLHLPWSLGHALFDPMEAPGSVRAAEPSSGAEASAQGRDAHRSPVAGFEGLAQALRAAGATLRLDLLDVPPQGPWPALQQLAQALATAGVETACVAVFPTTRAAILSVRSAFPQARVGGGTPHYFAQLNRAEHLPELDFLSFTTCPIVHAADDGTVMGTLTSLPGLLRTLQARHPGVPVHVGPSALAVRQSPLGESAPSDGFQPIPLAARDPRQRTGFGAAWWLGCLASLTHAGAESVSLFSLRGPRGVLLEESPEGPLLQPRLTPAGQLMAACGASRDMGAWRALLTDDPQRLAALWVRDQGDEREGAADAPPTPAELAGGHFLVAHLGAGQAQMAWPIWFKLAGAGERVVVNGLHEESSPDRWGSASAATWNARPLAAEAGKPLTIALSAHEVLCLSAGRSP